MELKLLPLHRHFAAELSGLDLAALPPAAVAAIKEAIDRYAVLVFPPQTSTTTASSPLAAAAARSSRRATIAWCAGCSTQK